MVAFGGAAPLHANRLLAEMKIPLLVIPPSPGTTSALGLLVSDLKHVYSHTSLITPDNLNLEEISRTFTALQDAGKRTLAREGILPEKMHFQREVEARYVGQSHEIPIPWPAGPLSRSTVDAVIAGFHQEHERAYGHGYPAESVEFVNFQVTATGLLTRPKLRELPGRSIDPEDARREVRPVFFAETQDLQQTAVYDRYRLSPGHTFPGPAIVEEIDSTSLIHPGFQAQVDRFGNLLVTAAV